MLVSKKPLANSTKGFLPICVLLIGPRKPTRKRDLTLAQCNLLSKIERAKSDQTRIETPTAISCLPRSSPTQRDQSPLLGGCLMELQMLAWTHHPARHSKQIESAIDAGIGLYRCLEFLRRVQIND